MPFLMEFDEKIRQENGMLNSFTQTTNQDLKIIKRNLIGWKNKTKTRSSGFEQMSLHIFIT